MFICLSSAIQSLDNNTINTNQIMLSPQILTTINFLEGLFLIKIMFVLPNGAVKFLGIVHILKNLLPYMGLMSLNILD